MSKTKKKTSSKNSKKRKPNRKKATLASVEKRNLKKTKKLKTYWKT